MGWISWFNHQRLLEPIGDVPPVEYEEAYYRRERAPEALTTLNNGALR
jgi:putative transposase